MNNLKVLVVVLLIVLRFVDVSKYVTFYFCLVNFLNVYQLAIKTNLCG